METVEKFGAQRWSVIASHLVGRVGNSVAALVVPLPEVKRAMDGGGGPADRRGRVRARNRGGDRQTAAGAHRQAIKNRHNSNQRRQLRMQRRAEAVAAGDCRRRNRGHRSAEEAEETGRRGRKGEGEEANCADGADEGAGAAAPRAKRKKAGDAEFSGTLFSGEGLSDDEGEEEGGAAQRSGAHLHLATQNRSATTLPPPLTHPTLPPSPGSGCPPGRAPPSAPGPRPHVTSSLLAPQSRASRKRAKKDALIELLMRRPSAPSGRRGGGCLTSASMTA